MNVGDNVQEREVEENCHAVIDECDNLKICLWCIAAISVKLGFVGASGCECDTSSSSTAFVRANTLRGSFFSIDDDGDGVPRVERTASIGVSHSSMMYKSLLNRVWTAEQAACQAPASTPPPSLRSMLSL